MLKQRLLTAAVLIPVFIIAVIFLPNDYFAILMAAIVFLGALEWAKLSGLKQQLLLIVYALLLLTLCLLLQFQVSLETKLLIIQSTIVWWLCALSLVIGFQLKLLHLPNHPILLCLIGLMVLIPSWLSLVTLHREPHGTILVLLLFALIWIADSVAYFAGQRWGKHRLANRVSPGKSWEGAFAAVLSALLIGLGYTIYQNMDMMSYMVFSLISLITVLSSILGDLFESLVKRSGNFKDSGGILPGHGGILDRIDSLTAAAPVFFCALYWSGYWS